MKRPSIQLQQLPWFLSRLPRDSRDTLFLLLVIAWILLPLVAELPLWCSLLACGVLVWRGWMALTLRALPSRWWVLGWLLLTLVATLLTFKTLFGRDAGVTLIVVLLCLKTLELKARRDAFVIFFLGFFTLLTHFFYSQTLPMAATMLVAVLGLLTALVNAHMPVGKPPLMQAAKTAGGMALLGAPIMVLLFVLFPRIAPLWGLPSDGLLGRSGLSATLQVGNIASLALDDSVVMRIRFLGARPPPAALYFRGPVLSDFDGLEWRPLRSSLPALLQLPANIRVQGVPVSYEVTLEPKRQPWLLTLDATPTPPLISGPNAMSATMTPALQWLTDRPASDLLRYTAQSYPAFQHGPTRQMAGLQDFLALPPGFNPRTLQWAADLRRDPRYAQADNLQLVNAVLARLHSGGYVYTLTPGVFGQHSADEFWFDRKAGFCEHMASSFVIVMRALDIPARIVTGYQGGEHNLVDGLWTVRQSDAHAWTEVWIPGAGWVRIDPTAAVSPARIGALQRLQAPAGLIASALGTVSPAFALNLRDLREAVNNAWNQYVLNFTQSKQISLLKGLGFKSPRWEDLIYLLIGFIVLVFLCSVSWNAWERRRQDPWLRLLNLVLNRLRKAGISVAPNSSARSIHAQLARQLGAETPFVMSMGDWLTKLEAYRYAPADAQPKRLATLQHELQFFSWPS